MLEAGDHAEDAALLRIRHLRLEADYVEEPTLRVVLAELDAGMRALGGARVDEAHRAHRAEGERVAAPARHLLDRHAALEVDAALELPRRHLLGLRHRLDERMVLLAVERAVDVVLPALAVARRLPCDRHV